MSNFVSKCCGGSIEIGRRPNKFRTMDILDVCGECGKQVVEPVEACECCGEPAERFIETRLGGWCQECIDLNTEELLAFGVDPGEEASA